MFDRIITSLNKLNHNLTILIIFGLGSCMAVAGFVLVALFPHVDHDIAKGMAGLGGIIVGGAMMAFRGGSDSSEFTQNGDGTATTKQAVVSGDPPPPVL